MQLNKENEDKSSETSKIPVLIRSLPKSGRPQPKSQQQRLLKTVARGPLNTLAFQRVNQDLAGPSHTPTRCITKFIINEKYIQDTATLTRNPLQTLTCANQNAGNSRESEKYPIAKKIIPCINSGGSSFKCLAGPNNSAERIIKLKEKEPKFESKIPALVHKQNDKNPLKFNSDLGIIGSKPCLAGPSSLNIESLDSSGLRKKDIMVTSAACMKDRILASSLDKGNFFTPPLELGSVKKVKRSLKRPHSRGLQNLPPFDIDLTNDAQKIDFEVKERKLKEAAVSPVIDNLTYYYTTDVLLYLLQAEKKPIGSNTPEDCRSCVINYMMQLNSSAGQSAVVQSAAWYIDSLCSSPDPVQLQLTAAACMWIASKLHLGAIHGMRMVRRGNRAFTIQDLALAEKRVLNELKFPSHPVIPNDFIPYLSWFCDPEPAMVETAATFLCLCGLTVSKSIGQEYASVVAVASVRTALMLLKMEEQTRRLEECPVYHLAMEKADILAVCAVLRESLHKMAAVNYEYKLALFHYSQKPYSIAPKLAYANHYDCCNLN